MKKFAFTIIALSLFLVSAGQPLSGVYSIPGTSPGGFATLAIAIDALNTHGAGGNGVTFNINADYSESVTAPLILTATGTESTPIIFTKSGNGANPIITRTDGGTLTTSVLGGQGDAVILIQGTDYVTFEAIDVTANNPGIEYGYYLRKSGPADGCKYVTIKDALITMNKGTSAFVAGIYSSNNDAASTVSSLSGVSLTSTGGRHENITIKGNTISNVFAGIIIRGFNHTTSPYNYYDQNFVVGTPGSGNTIRNFAGNNASTSYGIYLIYQNNATVAYNNIDNTDGGGSAATAMLYGIFNSTGNTSAFSATNNTLNITQGGATFALYGINSQSSGNLTVDNNSITLNASNPTSGIFGYIYNTSATSASAVSISNNTFNGSTIPCSGAMYLINNNSNVPGVSTISGNATSGNITKSGASGNFYGYYTAASPTGTENITENNFSNISVGGASYFYGIFSSTITSGFISNISRNTISNITVNGGLLYAMSLGGANNRTVNKNTISGLQGGNLIYGMLVNSGNPVNIYQNEYCNFVSSSVTNPFPTTHAIVKALQIGYGTLYANVYNNLISNLKTPVSTDENAISGIHIEQGDGATNEVTVNLFYNTIFLNAVSSSTSTFGTSCIYKVSTLMTGDFRNNILVNLSAPGPAGGFTVAYRMNDTYNPLYYSGVSNNNNLYSGPPASNRLLFYDTHNAGDMTLAQYRSTVFPADDQSVSVMPEFEQINVAPYDLRIKANVPSALESGGIPVSSPITVVSDYFNNARYPSPSTPVNSSFTPKASDIGAHEFGGINLDNVAPKIVFTPLKNTSITETRTIIATITDVNSGVPASGIGLPVLYWSRNGGTYVSVTAIPLGGDQFLFTFGGGVPGDQIAYYVAAQDNHVTPNVGSVPSAGNTTYSANPPAVNVPPLNAYYYLIIPGLRGTLTVGTPGGDYSNLTGASGAFSAINSMVLTGDLVLSIISDLEEDGYSELFAWLEDGIGNYTVTIRPSSATERLISGDVAYNGMIRLNGAERVVFDGRYNGAGKFLRLINANSSNPVFTFLNDASNNTIRNCYIEGVSTAATGLINFGSTNALTGNDNNSIIENVIRDRSNLPGIPSTMIYSMGKSGRENSSNSIINNEILNFSNFGIHVTSGSGNNWIINGNSFYNNLAVPLAAAFTPINFIPGAASNNNMIINNFIGGQGPACSGNAWNNAYAGAVSMYGISLNVGNATATSVQGNTIQNLLFSSNANAAFRGIYVASGTADIGTISGNLIGSLTTQNTISISGTQNTIGIYTLGNVNIANNTISNIIATHPTSVNTIYGMWLSGSQHVTAYNNKIMNIGPVTDATNTTTDRPTIGVNLTNTAATFYNNLISLGDDGFTHNTSIIGIRLASASGSVTLLHNSISLGGTMAAGNSRSCAAIQKETAGAVTLKNNIISNKIVDGVPGTAQHKAVNFTNNASVTSDYNTLYSTDPNTTAAWGATVYSFDNYRAASSQEANSLNVDPLFTSATDLHTTVPAINNAGVALSGVTTDFSGVLRTQPPDPGAYEFTLPVTSIQTLAATNVDQQGADLHGMINTNGEVVHIEFEWGPTESYGNSVAGTPTGIRSFTETHSGKTLIGLSINTLYHFRIKGTSVTSGQILYGNDMTFTTSSSVPVNTTVQNITIGNGHDTCFNATQTITIAGNGTTFTILNGGSATMVAGQNIIYLPGTVVEAGGYMLGYITTSSDFCYQTKLPASVASIENPETFAYLPGARFRVFPNPTSGKFTLEKTDGVYTGNATMEIIGLNGIRVLSQILSEEKRHVFNIGYLMPGLYFIRVITGKDVETVKLIRL